MTKKLTFLTRLSSVNTVYFSILLFGGCVMCTIKLVNLLFSFYETKTWRYSVSVFSMWGFWFVQVKWITFGCFHIVDSRLHVYVFQKGYLPLLISFRSNMEFTRSFEWFDEVDNWSHVAAAWFINGASRLIYPIVYDHIDRSDFLPRSKYKPIRVNRVEHCAVIGFHSFCNSTLVQAPGRIEAWEMRESISNWLKLLIFSTVTNRNLPA